jgi:hypothetical protein
MSQTPQFDSFNTQSLDALAQQPSQGQFALEPEFDDIAGAFTPISASRFPNKKKLTRIVAILLLLALCFALFFIWHTSAPTNSSPVITRQNFSGTSSNNNALC